MTIKYTNHEVLGDNIKTSITETVIFYFLTLVLQVTSRPWGVTLRGGNSGSQQEYNIMDRPLRVPKFAFGI